MNYRLFLTALIAAMTLFVSCDKDNDLQPQTTELETNSKVAPTLDADESTSQELKIAKSASLANARTDFAPPQKIFEKTVQLGKGHWYKPHIKKENLLPDHKYICKITPISGDPDLYIMGRPGTINRWRTIRKSTKGNLQIDESYGKKEDLIAEENRLYFNVYGYTSSKFKIEIFLIYESSFKPIHEDFETYRVGNNIADKSDFWKNTDAANPVKITFFGDAIHKGKALKFDKENQGVFLEFPEVRQGKYKMSWNLRKASDSELNIKFIAKGDKKIGTIVLKDKLFSVLIGTGGGAVSISDAKWIQTEMIFDFENQQIDIHFKQEDTAGSFHRVVELPSLMGLVFETVENPRNSGNSYGLDDFQFVKI